MGNVILGTLMNGTDLFNALWGAVGTVIVLGAVIMIIFKFFLGQGKNIGAGIGALLGVAVLAALAKNPQWVIDGGTALLNIVGIN